MKSWHVKIFPLFVHSMHVKVDLEIEHTSWCANQAIYCVFQILLSFFHHYLLSPLLFLHLGFHHHALTSNFLYK